MTPKYAGKPGAAPDALHCARRLAPFRSQVSLLLWRGTRFVRQCGKLKDKDMSRHLTPYFIEQALKRGKGVAQLLGGFEHDGEKAIRYLLIHQKSQGFLLWLQES